MNCSTPGFPVLHYLLEFAQIHVHWVSNAIEPSHPPLSPSPPTFNLSQHQGFFQGVSSLHQVWCELWCWRRLLRVPWTAKIFHQSFLKEICPEYSLEGLMLKLKLQYFGYLMWRTDSLEKTLMLRKIEGGRRRRRQRMRWLDGITDSMEMSWASSGSWWWTGKPGVLQSMGSQRVGHDWATKHYVILLLKQTKKQDNK